VVNLLQKLFIRFDQLCTANKVYKVHTIADQYVLMGYDGRIDKNKRSRGIVVNEINKIVSTALEMMDIVKEFRDQVENKKLKNLDMRIGIHTGKVVGGIIGSRFVRYDVFGEGVVIS
jgi:class 3 adenylate cyclase